MQKIFLYDFNGDGKYTNDIDLDSNGVIDIRDREIGALVMLKHLGRLGKWWLDLYFISFYRISWKLPQKMVWSSKNQKRLSTNYSS